MIENKYENLYTNVKSTYGVKKDFRIRVRDVYQNFILIPMSIIVMDEITKGIQNEVQ